MHENNKSEAATKTDLKELEQKLTGKIDSVEQKLTGKIDTVEQKLTGKIDAVEQKLTGKIDAVEQSLNGKIDAVEQKLTGKIDAVEQSLNGKIDAVEQKLNVKIDSVEQRLTGKIGSVETTVKHLAIELSKTQADVRQIKDDMATKMATKDDIGRILSAIDTYTAEAISYRNRDTLRGRAIMEHDDKLKNHETRILELETIRR